MKIRSNWLKIVVLCASGSFSAQAAQKVVSNSDAPVDNVVVSYDGETSMTMSARNRISQTPPDHKDRTLGQTFTLKDKALVNRITVKMGNNASVAGEEGQHILWLAIMSDTNGDESVDTLRGNIRAYDLSGFTTSKGEYLTFAFDAVELEPGLHGFEFGWQEDGKNRYDHDAQNLVVQRTTEGTYDGGGQLSRPDYTTFPNELSGRSSNDLFFYVQSVSEAHGVTLGLISPFE